jgi:predicted amidohydrolase
MKHRLGDPSFNLARHRFWLDRALKARARFIGFPEFSLTGWVEDAAQACSLDSAPVREIGRWARRHGVFIATCLVEKKGGRLFNTAVVFGPRGRIGAMRKVNLIARESRVYDPGRAFPVFDVAGCKLGIATCADATRFEMFHLLSLRGAEVIFAPHANTLGKYGNNPQGWIRWRRERWPWFARDTRVCILGVNNAGLFERPSDGDEPTKYCGGAMIVDTEGKTVAQSTVRTKRECMLVAEVDLVRVRALREHNFMAHEFRPAIVYNRKSGWVYGRV